VQRVIENRKQMERANCVDWGMAETLAYASLLANGYDVRLSGQDSGRAPSLIDTRFCTIRSASAGRRHLIPLQNISKTRATSCHRLGVIGRSGTRVRIRVLDAEPERAGDLGSAASATLPNGAQVVMDQFISSGRPSGAACAA